MFSNESHIKLITYTWAKDAHGLFDYESDEIFSMETNNIEKGGKMYRDVESNQTTFTKDNQEQGFFLTGEVKSCDDPNSIAYFYPMYGKLFLAKKVNTDMDFNRESLLELQEKVWRVIGQIELKGIKQKYVTSYKYVAKKNDIIRFGRVQFVIRHLYLSQLRDKKVEDCQEEEIKSLFIANDNDVLDMSDKHNIKCCICKLEEMLNDNPLIKPCTCAKSPFIHLNCFKEVFRLKELVNTTNLKGLTIVIVNNYSCDKCDEPYQTYVIKNDKEHRLLPYSLPDYGTYAIMESINFMKDNVYTMMVLIFRFPTENEEYFLGRGHEATFKVNDISISRVHSKIFIKSHQVIIDDLGSKFGTFVLCREDININQHFPVQGKVQIGRTLFCFDEITSASTEGLQAQLSNRNVNNNNNKIFGSKKKK